MAYEMNINPEFVERYQLELQKNPRSRVFAPLAEAYRKMGLLEEAQRICVRGTQFHPDFAGGHVAFAKVLIEIKDPAQALGHLEQATRLSPDNILAHSLMGETLLELRRPKDALKAFKMVLFLNPDDAKAQAAVRKWEFLTADEYDEPLFEMKPEFQAVAIEDLKARNLDEELESLLTEDLPTMEAKAAGVPESRLDLAQRHARALDRALSLADAFTVRNDLEAALKVVEDARRLLGSNPELERRAGLLARRLQVLQDTEDDSDQETRIEATRQSDFPLELELTPEPASDSKRARLEMLLRRISERRG